VTDGFGSRVPQAVGTTVQFSSACDRAINDRPEHTVGCHLLSVLQAAISQQSQIKEDTIKPSVLARAEILVSE